MKSLGNVVGTIFFTDRIDTIEVSKVRSALEVSDLDPDIAKELAARHCFSRVKNCLKDEGLIEEVSENDEFWIFQLSDRFRQGKTLTYEFKTHVTFNKKLQRIECQDSTVLEEAQRLYDKYATVYLPSDVSKLIRRIFSRQNGMLPLRHHGVVYFVPSEANSLMEKVTKFVETLGGDCLGIPINANQSALTNKVQASLVTNVQAEFQRIADELKTLREDAEGLSKRKATNRWKQLLGQLDRVKMYARSLQTDAKGLLDKIKTSEVNLAILVDDSGNDNLDVLAALAHKGKLSGVLGEIAKSAFDGELPAVTNPRVAKVAALLPDLEVPEIKNQTLPTPRVAAVEL